MTVKTEWSRDEAEALYDAAIYMMRETKEYGHLWEAAWQLRLQCGMSPDSNHAMSEVNKAVGIKL